MGRGICGIIPLEFEMDKSRENSLNKNLFSHFDLIEETSGKKKYKIKNEILLSNFKNFIFEFYNVISEIDELNNVDWAGVDIAFSEKNINSFLDIFHERHGKTPFIYKDYMAISVLDIKSSNYLVFYMGSYKAYLEEYRTFIHMERLTVNAINNPLSECIKFGIFG